MGKNQSGIKLLLVSRIQAILGLMVYSFSLMCIEAFRFLTLADSVYITRVNDGAAINHQSVAAVVGEAFSKLLSTWKRIN